MVDEALLSESFVTAVHDLLYNICIYIFLLLFTAISICWCDTYVCMIVDEAIVKRLYIVSFVYRSHDYYLYVGFETSNL